MYFDEAPADYALPEAHLNGEDAVCRSEAHVACAENVDGKAVADAVRGADDRLATFLDRRNGVLELLEGA